MMYYRLEQVADRGDLAVGKFSTDLAKVREDARRGMDHLTAGERKKFEYIINGWDASDEEALEKKLYGDAWAPEPDYQESVSQYGDPGDYVVMGFGVEEYGVEWGYEIDEYGHAHIRVSTVNNEVEYYENERDANARCEEIVMS